MTQVTNSLFAVVHPMTTFHCREILESDWLAILRIQGEVYYDFTPESESVMRSKTTLGPRTCFVAVDQERSVVAYCLAHPYPAHQIAVLGAAGPAELEPTTNLFLHDLAVQKDFFGRGVAHALFDHLTTVAQANGYQTMSLVAVQQAAGFWMKMGFTPSTRATINKSYTGDATFMTKAIG
ncbi:Acetyltransferase (GNAT) family protein [Rubripirellula tenax]|uniref:Acetyltransferase (GNAT) family protein n=1 Tax=Rubripirellula tenax TaxID=2528015 RepID=A0A5C6EL92_9BACT|nr:GNAT family N-acetyltransferase [Rubripirellula tenax]TWU48877.1 Acetyltransferase (GNAT) family protein [Rubripirellula tenax]